jgi:hypothetical protein
MPILLTRAQFNNLLLMIRHNINESVVGPPPSATTPMQPPANMSEGDAEKLKEQQQVPFFLLPVSFLFPFKNYIYTFF